MIFLPELKKNDAMVSPFSYSSNPADGGIIYLDGLTSEKEQRIQIVSFNDILISPLDIGILEERPSLSEEEKEEINSKNIPEAEKKKLLDDLKKKTTEDKKRQKREAKKIAYDIADQFNRRASMNGRCKNKFMGVVLSFPDSEREMLEKDPHLMESIVRDWLDGMGFEDAQHFAVYHYDTAQPHIHLYVNMVGPDLKVYNSFQTKYRSQGVNRDIEKKYGLKPGIGIDVKNKVDLEKTNPKNKVRMGILKTVQLGLRRYAISLEEMKKGLKYYGIEMKVSEKNNGKKGLVFTKDNVSFSGGDLGRMYTYGNLSKQLEENREQLPILKKLSGYVGLDNAVFDKILYGREKADKANNNKAQHRRSYETSDLIAWAGDGKGGDEHGILRMHGKYYISATPIQKGDISKYDWIDIDGRKCSYASLVAKPTAGKTVTPGGTVTVSVSSGRSSSVPDIVPAGATVRDNKSAAHNGDGLDEVEEVVDEAGNKKTVKKKTNKLKI